MIKKHTPYAWIANIFFWGTVFGLPIGMLWNTIGNIFLLPGANSLRLCMDYGVLTESGIIPIIGRVWFYGCLLSLIPAYCLAVRKGRYFPLGLIMVGDTVWVCACALFEFLRENSSGVTVLLPDIFISAAMCCVLMYCVPAKKK